MKNITVLIYTYNEEKNIKEAIESAKLLTNRIILVDQESTDKTVKIAEKMGARVLSFPRSKYVEPAREFGIKKAGADWVLILDGDERITKELASEIKKIGDKFSHYKIPRKNIFGRKKWLKHGGWWPDYQLRLISKKHFVKWPKIIHSTPQISGELGYVHKPLIHYFHGDIEKMVGKTIVFEDIESDLLYKAGRDVSVATFFRKYFGELSRRLIRKAGFLDGSVGIIESIYQAYSKTITWLFLYEKKKKSRSL